MPSRLRPRRLPAKFDCGSLYPEFIHCLLLTQKRSGLMVATCGALLLFAAAVNHDQTGVTNVTNQDASLVQNCGTIVSTIMQVFTTIYLAETLRANIACVEETLGLDQQLPGVQEFKRTLRKRIAMLENRCFYEDDEAGD